MRPIFLVIPLILLVIRLNGQTTTTAPQPGALTQTQYFAFYGHYWLNMHHFLFDEALLTDSLRTALAEKYEAELGEKSFAQLDRAVAYYQRHFVKKDLRTNDYLYEFKRWVITQEEQQLVGAPDSFQVHILELLEFDPLYRQYFWPDHQEKLQSVLNNNIALIRATEEKVVKRLELLTREHWQEHPIRTDLCIHGKTSIYSKRDRPYTTVYPTHIVMHVGDTPAGNWLELLYHEASHHLIGGVSGFVGGTIENIRAVEQLRIPRGLWHAYLFYFSGKVTQDVLLEQGFKEYELYMSRNRVFGFVWPYLDQFLPAYINQEQTLEMVTRSILKAFAEDRK